MKWPWISRRAYELLEQTYERTIKERDAQTERADRLADQLVNRFGFEPVSAPVRDELKQAAAEVEKYLDASQYEDVGAGMLSEDVINWAKEHGAAS